MASTALIQAVVVVFSGSVALLSDTIHNFADAATALPLGIAFMLARRPANDRFSYGYGRAEDLAGMAVVLFMLFSAVAAGYVAIDRLFHPQAVGFLTAVAAAAVVGFLGNEGVAVLRIRVGKEIGSAALVADGYHARTDGLTSLAVLFGALGVWLGYPLADPLVGLLITAMIVTIVWQAGKPVLARLADAVEPGVLDQVRHAASHVRGVKDVSEVRARWSGHDLVVEANIAVDTSSSIAVAHGIAKQVRREILEHLERASIVTVHVDPVGESGEHHHSALPPEHDEAEHASEERRRDDPFHAHDASPSRPP